MKAVVAVKRVIDHNVKIHVKADQTSVVYDNVKMSMNPFDENALEEAVQLKEAGKIKSVIAVTIGPDKAEDVLRTALAMGADKAVLIKTTIPTNIINIESLTVAKSLKKFIEIESPDLVFLGKQAIDNESFETGQMLAALLGWGHGLAVSALELKDDRTIEIARETEQGLEFLSLKLPCVITTDLRLNEPRYASLPNIMKARSKPLDVITPTDLMEEYEPRLDIIKVEPPPPRTTNGAAFISLDKAVEKIKQARS